MAIRPATRCDRVAIRNTRLEHAGAQNVELAGQVRCLWQYRGVLEELRRRLEASGYRGDLLDDAGTRAVYGTDNSIYQLSPVGVAVPNNAADVALLASLNNALPEPFDLVARGGGTGTNGQSLTNGLVVDTRRRMNRIISVDPENRRAVVEPGVVLDELNTALRPHDLFFAPHVSAGTRATIGGMVATDAAGKGSMVHGRTNDHVDQIHAVLADGTSFSTETASNGPAPDIHSGERLGKLHRELRLATENITPDSFPAVPRGFTGYNLADCGAAPILDLTKLLCGSEGTLALMTRVAIRLTPLPQDPHLVVVAFPTFGQAIGEANRLKAARPTAIECLDERTISMARASPAWPTLVRMLPEANDALLLIEFEGREGVEKVRLMIDQDSSATGVAIASDDAERAAVWKIRADAVGLLGQAVGGRRSVAFVEDCAVPPEHLEKFVQAFRELLDSHELRYGMFGHADVGCVHVRPALDLYDPAQESLVRTISGEVAALVASFGGVLWGEHGCGFRGEFVSLSPDMLHRMRQVKTAFDPRNVLNPGKLYTPLGSDQPVRKIDGVPLRVHADRRVGEVSRKQFASAFECNGNGICHHWGATEVMCPSFKATADPRLSPKGRADLLRAWLARPDDQALGLAAEESLNQCLSCAACTGRCPIQVDIPEMKSRFLERHGESDRKRRARTAILRHFETLLPLMQRVAGPTRVTQRLLAPAMEKALSIVDLPIVPPGGLATVAANAGAPLLDPSSEVGDATVVVLPDAFTAFLDPAVLSGTLRLLQIMGEKPAVAAFEPSGKLDYVKGNRKGFAKAAARQRLMLEAWSELKVDLVVIEPAVALLHRHEYLAIDPTFPSETAIPLASYLAPRISNLPLGNDRGVVQLFSHCTELSLAADNLRTYQSLLERAGFTVKTESTTCCGMAGVFGHEAENQAMSQKLFNDGWRPLLDTSGPVARCASGYSCRSQARRLNAPELLHPVEIVVG